MMITPIEIEKVLVTQENTIQIINALLAEREAAALPRSPGRGGWSAVEILVHLRLR